MAIFLINACLNSITGKNPPGWGCLVTFINNVSHISAGQVLLVEVTLSTINLW